MRRRHIGYRRVLVEPIGRVDGIRAALGRRLAVADVVEVAGMLCALCVLCGGTQLANMSASELIPHRGRDLTGEVFERRALALFVVCHAVSGDSIPNSVDERLGSLLKNFAAGVGTTVDCHSSYFSCHS